MKSSRRWCAAMRQRRRTSSSPRCSGSSARCRIVHFWLEMASANPAQDVTCAELRPYTLVAELTYRCPLACVYCSNPSDFHRHRPELETHEWLDVIRGAEALGVVQLNLSGGEPLLREDLEALVAEAQRLQLYTNLITSGLPLARSRLSNLRDAGLANVQLSVQDT